MTRATTMEEPVKAEQPGSRDGRAALPLRPRGRGDQRLIDAQTFETAFGESLANALNLATWRSGEDFAAVLDQLRQEIRQSVGQEEHLHAAIRRHIFPRLAARPRAVKGAGVYQVQPEHLAQVHRTLLLNGGVEVCDGTVAVHEALPISIIRIGLCLLSYHGHEHRYSQQFFRRDLRQNDADPVEQLLATLERRQDRAGVDPHEQRDVLSELSRRGLMSYAERAVLAQESKAIWRMGHGTPMPVELLSGSGSMQLMEAGVQVVRTLVEEHRRFLFVPSAARERDWLTIGQALAPLQFAIVDTMQDRLQRIVDATTHFSPAYQQLAQRFVDEVGPQIALGLFRVSVAAPAMLFYAHVDHAAEAAVVAMADSALQTHRGFPLLIDLADRFCREHFGQETLRSVAQEAYADAGAPFRYLAERDGRLKG